MFTSRPLLQLSLGKVLRNPLQQVTNNSEDYTRTVHPPRQKLADSSIFEASL
jgi:hypothetical protein